jgi:hypothetical protein
VRGAAGAAQLRRRRDGQRRRYRADHPRVCPHVQFHRDNFSPAKNIAHAISIVMQQPVILNGNGLVALASTLF